MIFFLDQFDNLSLTFVTVTNVKKLVKDSEVFKIFPKDFFNDREFSVVVVPQVNLATGLGNSRQVAVPDTQSVLIYKGINYAVIEVVSGPSKNIKEYKLIVGKLNSVQFGERTATVDL